MRVWRLLDIETRSDPDFNVDYEGQGTAIAAVQAEDNGEVMFAVVDYWHCSCYGSYEAARDMVYTRDGQLKLGQFSDASEFKSLNMDDLVPISAQFVEDRVVHGLGPLGMKIFEDDFDVFEVKHQNEFMYDMIRNYNLIIVGDKFFPRDSDMVRDAALSSLKKGKMVQNVLGGVTKQ